MSTVQPQPITCNTRALANRLDLIQVYPIGTTSSGSALFNEYELSESSVSDQNVVKFFSFNNESYDNLFAHYRRIVVLLCVIDSPLCVCKYSNKAS